MIGEGLDILARTGDLPRYAAQGRPAGHRGDRGTAGIRRSAPVTWQRLFLTREEAVALGVLLLAEFGWNLSVISRLPRCPWRPRTRARTGTRPTASRW